MATCTGTSPAAVSRQSMKPDHDLLSLPRGVCLSLPSALKRRLNRLVSLKSSMASGISPSRPAVSMNADQASDCCGTGCTPCVFDLYQQELTLWEKDYERIKAGGSVQDTGTCDVLSVTEYHEFVLSEVMQLAPDTNQYKFLVPSHQALPLNVGQHLVLRWKNEEHVLTRQYTPISSPCDRRFFLIIIKIYPKGRMSQYISSWKVNDKVEWRGPFGSFSYSVNLYSRILMLAAGTGIAPMIPVIRHILENENDETRISLFYCCQTYQDLLYLDQLREWSGFWNFSAIYYLSTESIEHPTTRHYLDKIVPSRLDRVHLQQYFTPGPLTKMTPVLICGTKSFNKDMINYLTHVDIPLDNIFKFG